MIFVYKEILSCLPAEVISMIGKWMFEYRVRELESRLHMAATSVCLLEPYVASRWRYSESKCPYHRWRHWFFEDGSLMESYHMYILPADPNVIFSFEKYIDTEHIVVFPSEFGSEHDLLKTKEIPSNTFMSMHAF